MLAAGAVARATLPLDIVSRPSLLAYQATLCLIAVGLLAGLLTPDLERVDVTDLVVELGTERTPGLRAALSRALGDPSLEVGYWYAEAGAFVGADGRSLDLPDPASTRTVTFVEHEGEPVAALVHDPAALDDPRSRDGLNSRDPARCRERPTSGEVRARVAELEDSRRRILDARTRNRSAGTPAARGSPASAGGGGHDARPRPSSASSADDGRVVVTPRTRSARPGGAAPARTRAPPRLLTELGWSAALRPWSTAFPSRSTSRSSTAGSHAAVGRGRGLLRLRGGAGERRQVCVRVALAGPIVADEPA